MPNKLSSTLILVDACVSCVGVAWWCSRSHCHLTAPRFDAEFLCDCMCGVSYLLPCTCGFPLGSLDFPHCPKNLTNLPLGTIVSIYF